MMTIGLVFFTCFAFGHACADDVSLRQKTANAVDVLICCGVSDVLNPFCETQYPRCIRVIEVMENGEDKRLTGFSDDWAVPFSGNAWIEMERNGIAGVRLELSDLLPGKPAGSTADIVVEVSQRALTTFPRFPGGKPTHFWNKLLEIDENAVALRSSKLKVRFAVPPRINIDELYSETAGNWEEFHSPFLWRDKPTLRPVEIDLTLVDNSNFQVTFTNTHPSHINLRDPFIRGVHGALLVAFDAERQFVGVYDLFGRFSAPQPRFITVPSHGIVGGRLGFNDTQLVNTTSELGAPMHSAEAVVKKTKEVKFLQVIADPGIVSFNNNFGGRIRRLLRSNVVEVKRSPSSQGQSM